jgi:type II secretory pathway pseudopilin PulG
LAEVLITLGIIGIVAALTMPGLIASYQKEVLRTRFKKVYSVLSQNFQKTLMTDFDGNISCYRGLSGASTDQSGCVAFYEKFMQNMNVVKTCKGNALAGGCIPEYSPYSNQSGCQGFNSTYMNNTNWAYVFSDGSIFIIYAGNGWAIFAIDTNGKQGPNKLGHDLFSLAIFYDGAVYRFGGDTLTECWNNTDYTGGLFKTVTDVYGN